MHECLKVCCDCKDISGTTWDFNNNLIKINFVYESVDVFVSVYHHASVSTFMCMHCTPCVLVPEKSRGGNQIPWIWKYRPLSGERYVEGVWTWSFGRIAGAHFC